MWERKTFPSTNLAKMYRYLLLICLALLDDVTAKIRKWNILPVLQINLRFEKQSLVKTSHIISDVNASL